MHLKSRKILRTLAIAGTAVLLTGISVGAQGAVPAHSATASQNSGWYCVIGTPQSGGVEPYSQPIPGKACYHDQFAAFAASDRAMGMQPIDYSKLGNADIPPGGSLNAAGCSIFAPHGSMQPGHFYYGRCANGIIVGVEKLH